MMKHHFGDMLDRDGDYWTVLPNMDRYAYSIEEVVPNSEGITIVTIGKDDNNWGVISTLPNLEEVTLQEPSLEQAEKLSSIPNLKRLRITHFRPKDLEFITRCANVEELVLEYVSGFSDLSPLCALKKLKSLHLENLRRVKDFSGLSGIKSLRYLRIDGTLDWKQPIKDFEFISGLIKLEVLSFGQVITKAMYPAFLPILRLQHLNKIRMSWNMFDAKEYALLDVGLEGVQGADFGPYKRFAYSTIPLPKDDLRYHLSDELIRKNHPDVSILYSGERRIGDPKDEWLECTGKKAGRVKCTSANSGPKSEEYSKLYEAYKDEAREVVNKWRIQSM